MTPSLHGTFGGPVSAGVTPGASPASFSTAGMQQPGHIRPLTLDTLRRGDMAPGYGSPTAGMNPNMSSIAFTPPRSATDTMSPISGPDMSAFGFAQRPALDSPRGMYRPPHQGPPYSQAPRPLAGHDRFRRASGEQASSPLRSSLSYDSITSQSTQPQDQRNEGQGYMPQQEGQRNMPPPSGPPYGLGFSCKCQGCCYSRNAQRVSCSPATDLNYPPNVRPPPQPPATSSPGIEMMQPYQREGQQVLGQHQQTFPEYHNFHETVPYQSPQVPQYSTQYAGHYGPPQNAYSTSYISRPDQQSQPPSAHSGIPGQLPRPHFGDNPSGDSEGDTSTGAAPITTSY